jgi:hypothetical protein
MGRPAVARDAELAVRMHGRKAPAACKGNSHAWRYSAEANRPSARVEGVLRGMKALVEQVKGDK